MTTGAYICIEKQKIATMHSSVVMRSLIPGSCQSGMALGSVVCAGASVSLPIEARKCLRVLGEQGMLQFFVAVKVRESRQLFLKVSQTVYFHPQYVVCCAYVVSFPGPRRG